MNQMLRRRWWLLPLGLLACVPDHWAYLHVPLTPTDGQARELAIVSVPLGELAVRLADFDAEACAFYGTGRSPLAYTLVDLDGDGIRDHAQIKLPVAAAGSGLTVTCPGPRATNPQPTGGSTGGVELDFQHATR